MTLEELKPQIESNTLNNNLLIFVCSGNGDFIYHQYLNEFAKNNKCAIEIINDFPKSYSLFTSHTNNVLYTLTVDKIDKVDYHLQDKEYLFVKCKSINKKLQEQYNNNIVICNSLESWQIKDYINSIIPEVNIREKEYLSTVYKDDIYRIDNELQKLIIFNNYATIYPQIKDQLFVDSTEYKVFDLINALVKRNNELLTKVLSNIDNIDVNVFGIITLLINAFKNVINVQLTRNASAENLGLSGKQFWAIQKYSCGYYSKDELIKIYKIINDIDYQIKTGYIDTDMCINYLITKIMTVKEI